jgi:hypothetical protein
MKQRVVALVAHYLEHRVRGRITRVRPVHTSAGTSDDYLVAVQDVRDGRTHLLHDIEDVRTWLMSFKTGECLRPVAAICEVCDRLHNHRGPDGELVTNCVTCQLELVDIYTDLRERRDQG